ncbi:DUF1631 family protein [Curvibacter sp. CHRR-16]|uniref:DUF1631 family protein n=1 Tax=Curvibacter sp. CHRR-16 TaxID=2835872 RepID=UPI001BDA6148|nr:DUF1631 family protein [Curvibacter sp. CHRR-16]MBT0571698.1 DUF1631 family protein [Curvibacter sp. CHRR-16]
MVAPKPEYPQLYQSLLEQAVQSAGPLMGRMVIVAKREFQNRLDTGRDIRERNIVNDALLQLQRNEEQLTVQFPQQLRQAFVQNKPSAVAAPKLSLSDMSFEQLELMDEEQVQESVVNARVQQNALAVLEVLLSELNTLVPPLQGLTAVRQDANPFRPEIYLQALKGAINGTEMPLPTRLEWLNSMGLTLAQELRVLYTEWIQLLKDKGVEPAGFEVVSSAGVYERAVGRQVVPQPMGGLTQQVVASRMAASAPQAAGRSAGSAPRTSSGSRVAADPLLTLERLRSLLAGDMEDVPRPTSRVQAFAQNFARQFEASGSNDYPVITEFQSTVPAALEALQEMQQTEAMLERLEQRSKQVVDEFPFEEEERILAFEKEGIRATASNVAQRLSLEVVQMMVETMAQDGRLLPRVQRVVRQLEPPLMRLAMAEPRLFTDRNHPARQLLNEVSQRSLAFGSEKAEGYTEFLSGIEAAVSLLNTDASYNAQSFERVLTGLLARWQAREQAQAQAKERAVRALQQAEQRHVLAQKIAEDVQRLPDIHKVPSVVTRFLLGPWAQVVAQARLVHGQRSEPANKYQALISALLWSSHPELPLRNVSKLTRLVPVLLGTLRDGLESIDYPADKTGEFLEALMGLHQKVFSSLKGIKAVTTASKPIEKVDIASLDQAEPWLAPAEAKQSNFVEISEVESVEIADDDGDEIADMDAARAIEGGIAMMPLGTWIELFVGGQWIRTQLTWASPHGTLFLFTSAQGKTQSMTRRTHDKLVSNGQLMVVADHSLVDGALDAVAQQAMRNSL